MLDLDKPKIRIAIGAAALVLLILLLAALKEILVPVFIAMAVAYVGNPIIDYLETKKISRTWGIVILISGICLIVLGLTGYLLPKIVDQVEHLVNILPGYWDRLNETLMPRLKGVIDANQETVVEIQDSAVAWLKENGGKLLQSITAGLANSFLSIGNFIANILALIIIPVLAFYFLRDFGMIKRQAVDLIPPNQRAFVVGLSTELDQALGNFIKGQLLVAMILAFIYSVGLAIAGCPAWLLIGIIAGFANLVPYLGIALGLIPAVLLTYLTGNPLWQVIVAALTFVVGQMLEGMVITPKVVGDTIGLHPAVVMVGLMVGGTYFGFVGMILALPSCAVLMVLLRRAYLFYIDSPFYKPVKAGKSVNKGRQNHPTISD